MWEFFSINRNKKKWKITHKTHNTISISYQSISLIQVTWWFNSFGVNSLACHFTKCETWRECFQNILRTCRSSHHRCSIKKCVLRNFTKFTGKQLYQSLFFKTLEKVFSSEFCEIFKNTFFTEHLRWLLPVAASKLAFKTTLDSSHQVASRYLPVQT